MHVKKGQRVVVISGNDKGHEGEVQEVYPGKNQVLVEGANMRWKHRKPTQQEPKGERVRIEVPFHASNVMPIDPATGKATRKRITEAS